VSPIFIIGSGRSGNTLLRRILTRSEELYIPPETYVLGDAIRNFPEYSRLNWPSTCQLILGKFSVSEDFETFPTAALRPAYEAMLALPDQDRTLAKSLDILYCHFASIAKPEATRWGDKTPLNTQSLELIHAVFPKARYVHIMRDGFDVVASYLKMGRYVDPDDAVKRWVESTNACRAFTARHPSQVMEVRYEALVQDPSAIVSDLCAFLGLGYSPEMITGSAKRDELGDIGARAHYVNVLAAINTGSIGKGRASLAPNILARIEPVIEPQMAVLGLTDLAPKSRTKGL